MAWFTPKTGEPTQTTITAAKTDADTIIQAAVGPLARKPGGTQFFTNTKDTRTKQQTIIGYDENGPGFVGYYLDLYSMLAAEPPLIIRTRNDQGQWERNDSGQAKQWLTNIKGVNEDQHAFHQANCRAIIAVGETALWPHKEGPSHGWHRTLPHIVKEDGKHPTIPGAPANYIVPLAPGAETDKKSLDRLVVPYERMRRIWHPSTAYPMLPQSALFRAIPDIRRFASLSRNMQRSSMAMLLMQGLLWFEGDARDVVGKPDGGDGPAARLGPLGKQLESLMRSAQRNADDIEEKQVAAAFPHPFVYKTEPKKVDLGTAIDPTIIDGKRDALEDVARSLEGPMSAIVEGQGAAHRLLNEMRQDDAINKAAFNVSARVALGYTLTVLDPSLPPSERGRHQVFVDRSYLEDTSTDSDEDLELWRLGVLGRDELARRRNIDPAGVLSLPDGVTEYDHWIATKAPRQTAATGAETAAPDPETVTAAWWDW